MSAQRRMASRQEMSQRQSKNGNNKEKKEVPLVTLITEITAAKANHSYNGIIFDIEVKGPFEVELHSVSIGGMLGPMVNIYIYYTNNIYNIYVAYNMHVYMLYYRVSLCVTVLGSEITKINQRHNGTLLILLLYL